MLIYLLLIYILGSQNEVRADFRKFGVPKNELKRLADLKYYLCGLSPADNNGSRFWRGIGWFCVDKRSCSSQKNEHIIENDTRPELACDDLRYNEGRDTCCFTGNLLPLISFDNPQFPDWDLYVYVKNQTITDDIAVMEEYKFSLYQEYIQGKNSPLEAAMAHHEICSVIPISKRLEKTEWTPYLCLTNEQCAKPPRDLVIGNITFPFGDRFCAKSLRYKDRPKCCHVSQAVPDNVDQNFWKFSEFLGTQKYAPGFRSKFMCEAYNKLVCGENLDHCAQKVLHRTHNTLPGEFPHHALVGIVLPRRQTWHCQGSIISKMFVLTSYDCREHDNTLANAVLVGTFNFDTDQAPSIDKQVSYVKNHMSDFSKHWFLLLQLWRPLILSAFVKPACIDWFTFNQLDRSLQGFQGFSDFSSKTFDFGTGWMVGYGPLGLAGNFTTDVKRYIYNFKSPSGLSPQEMEIQCKRRMPEKKMEFLKGEFKNMKSHICFLVDSVYSPYLDKQKIRGLTVSKEHLGYFSQGASFSVFERYCQWKVYGVYIQNEKFLTDPPLLFETIPYALAWIEEIIWKDEFNWLFFNMTWPDCADWENYNETPSRKGGKANEAEHQFNFYSEDYYYLKPQYNSFFDGQPW